jgi:hypothetical protein
LEAATSCVPWSDWNLFGAPCNAMNLLTAIKKDSVEYDSAISTCARDVDVHTKMTPHAFPVVRLFTDPTMGNGPNRSTAVEKNGGVGPILCSGRGAIFCSPNLLADLLHVKHEFFTALAFGRT